MLELVTLAATLVVPEILSVVILEIAPLITALPVIPKVLDPAKVELMVVVAAVIAVAPRAVEPPTAPVKVTAPVPAAMVKARLAALPLSVPPKLTSLLVVVKVMGVAARVTLPL